MSDIMLFINSEELPSNTHNRPLIKERTLFQQIPIYHMASMARSGETLLMRCMAAHPRVVYSHNLWASDSRRDDRLFRLLKKRRAQTILAKHPLLMHKKPKSRNILFVKQGVWEHRHAFQGFVLARNPLAIYASMKVFDSDQKNSPYGHCWWLNQRRMVRWMLEVDPGLVGQLGKISPLEQFVLFYCRRMAPLAELGLPVIQYEQLVSNPEFQLRRVCEALNVEFDPAVLNSHEHYKSFRQGHGKSDLSRPISKASLNQFKNVLFPWEIERITQSCAAVAARLGYSISQGEITLSETTYQNHTEMPPIVVKSPGVGGEKQA